MRDFLKEISELGGDTELLHMNADELIIDMLREIADGRVFESDYIKKVADIFDDLPKWYS